MPPMDNRSAPVVVLDDETPASSPITIVDEAGAPAVVVDEQESGEYELPARAHRNADGSITLTLLKKQTLSVRSASGSVNQKTFTELTFHRMAGADLIAVQNASRQSQPFVLLARSARMHLPVMKALFELMDAEDIADASGIVGHFLGNGRSQREKS